MTGDQWPTWAHEAPALPDHIIRRRDHIVAALVLVLVLLALVALLLVPGAAPEPGFSPTPTTQPEGATP